MPDQFAFRTDRLHLRAWQESDRESFAAINSDPEVMQFFPSTLTPAESDGMMERIQASFSERGWGLWAVDVMKPTLELPDRKFIGFVGLAIPRFDAHFTPCVEIGWRLARAAWGQGFATEAANAVIQFAFRQLNLPEIVSFTASCNKRSERVMQRLGMSHSPYDDFDHPLLPDGHPLRRHLLYRLRNVGEASADRRG